MKIETEYSVNDTVVFLEENKIWTGSIIAVHVTAYNTIYVVKYDVRCVMPNCAEFDGLASNRLFKTKEDLIKSL